jgi:hypothetical protein
MRFLYVLDGIVISSGAIAEGQPATLSGPPGSIEVTVNDSDPAQVGWLYDAETGTLAAPAPVRRTTMSPVRFRAQFGIQAKVAIRRARSYVDGTFTDAKADADAKDARDVLEELFADLDDPRLLEVDVADPDVIEGIDFVHSLGFIDKEHAERIKLGIQEPV